MPADLLNALFSNVWAVFLIVLFFGGSIFVHELGHFLAARRRGVKVARFSIGFGPRMFGWTGKDGVDYRVSWLPLGGYVLLPQLADMAAIEGEADFDTKDLPPVTYATRIIVFAAGAVFNLLFAFLLATVIWFVGQPTMSYEATTQIGYVLGEFENASGEVVTSPAKEAGLRAGDIIRAIDGSRVDNWSEIQAAIVLSAGRTDEGRRETTLLIERDGREVEITVHPQLAGDDEVRTIGISPAYEPIVRDIEQNQRWFELGLRPGDRIVQLGDTRIYNAQTFGDQLARTRNEAVKLDVIRDGRPLELELPPNPAGSDLEQQSIFFTTDSKLTFPTPVEQFTGHVKTTVKTLSSLINPSSDVGISKMSGPVGIIRVFHLAAQADIRLVLWFTILVNINLAIFNLLPIPVLDGGHMLFATINKLRGRALPESFVMTTQSVFMVLLFSMIIYVSFFDVGRWRRDAAREAAREEAATEQAENGGE